MADVLVVETSDTLRVMLIRSLKRMGFNAVGSPNPADAVAACVHGNEPPDLILATFHSPELADLVAFITPFRDHRGVRGIPLVIATDEPGLTSEAKALGACECLVRSWVDFDKLAECVRRNLLPTTSPPAVAAAT